MYTTTATQGSKFTGIVRSEDERTLHTTPGYYTEAMALAAAKCWAAFHGERVMDDIVKDTQIFAAREALTGKLHLLGPDRMREVIKNNRDHGVTISVCTGVGGRKYINTHIGGSSYGTYFYVG